MGRRSGFSSAGFAFSGRSEYIFWELDTLRDISPQRDSGLVGMPPSYGSFVDVGARCVPIQAY